MIQLKYSSFNLTIALSINTEPYLSYSMLNWAIAISMRMLSSDAADERRLRFGCGGACDDLTGDDDGDDDEIDPTRLLRC